MCLCKKKKEWRKGALFYYCYFLLEEKGKTYYGRKLGKGLFLERSTLPSVRRGKRRAFAAKPANGKVERKNEPYHNDATHPKELTLS